MKIIDMVVTEEGCNDIAFNLPTLKLSAAVSFSFGRAGHFSYSAVNYFVAEFVVMPVTFKCVFIV